MAYRKEKLEKQIIRLISEVIIKEINDPRIGFASITEVNLNKDCSIAHVGISVIGDPKDRRKALDGLNSARGYIQRFVGKNLRIRNVPKIKFELDSSVADGVRMVDLLENLDGVERSEHVEYEEDIQESQKNQDINGEEGSIESRDTDTE